MEVLKVIGGRIEAVNYTKVIFPFKVVNVGWLPYQHLISVVSCLVAHQFNSCMAESKGIPVQQLTHPKIRYVVSAT